MPNPKLPDRECYECPEGNRFASHIRTEVQPSGELGPEPSEDHIAIYRCSKCGDVTREAFDPAMPG